MDIPAIDTTTPMGQQAYMTRDQAYMFNSQVNSFLCSCPLYLDNGNVHALVFLGMMERIRREGHLHGLNSTMSSFVEQMELLVLFPTFHAATIEERRMELFLLFRTSHTAEVSIERNSSLQRWIEANEYSLKSP